MSQLTQRLTRELGQIADHAAPSPGAWDAIRTRIDEQADEPDVEVIMLAPNEKQRNRKWIAAALAAAAVVVVVIIGAVALTGDEDAAPDTAVRPDPSVDDAAPPGEGLDPVGVAEAYMAARDAWDGAAAAALFTPDAVFEDGPVTAAEHVADAAFQQAIDFRLLDPDCVALAMGPPAEVACSFTVRNAWSEALGSGPLVDSGFVLVIDDGLIQELREEPGLDPGFGNAWVVFRNWIEDNHSGDLDSMYDPDGGVRLDDAALALFEQRTIEFTAFHVAQDYLAAVNEWDGAATAALLAEDALEEGLDRVEANAEFERAIGYQLLDPTCSTASVDTSVEVTCSFTVQNAWSEALGSGPLDDSGFVFVVADGLITELREEPGFDPGFGTAWVVFRNWIEENHPDDLDRMYASDGLVVLTTEAIALFEQRTAEFVAAQGA